MPIYTYVNNWVIQSDHKIVRVETQNCSPKYEDWLSARPNEFAVNLLAIQYHQKTSIHILNSKLLLYLSS